jgi:phosphomannomutase
MKIFGTDGIRCLVNEDQNIQKDNQNPLQNFLSDSFLNKIVVAVSKLDLSIGANGNSDYHPDQFNFQHYSYKKRRIIIGRDTRLSGIRIQKTLSKAFVNLDFEVFITDEITTPILANFMKNNLYNYGFMITASHNTSEYNGIKIFDTTGRKISKIAENSIEKYVNHLINNKILDPNHDLDEKDENSIKNQFIITNIHEKMVSEYKNFIKTIFKSANAKVRILLDCANGSTSFFAKEVFKSIFINADIIVVNSDISDERLNIDSGVLNFDILRSYSEKYEFDFCFAFDGDGDRVIAVDKFNNIIDGDQFLAFFVDNFEVFKNILCQNSKIQGINFNLNPKVVFTVDSNSSLIDFLNNKNVEYFISNVGDKNVVNQMIENECSIGVEKSGHIITFLNEFCGDGILVACAFLRCLVEKFYNNISTTFDDDLSLNSSSSLILDSIFPFFEKNREINIKIKSEDFYKICNSCATTPLNNETITTTDKYNICCSTELDSPLLSEVYICMGDCNLINHSEKSDFIKICHKLHEYLFSEFNKIDQFENSIISKIVIRPSGTEPIIRFLMEIKSKNQNIFNKIQVICQNLFK